MIKKIFNEKNKSIRDVILAYANTTYNENKLYFALTKINHDLAAIGYSYENFIKCEANTNEYIYFETTYFEMKLYTEITNKQISNKYLYKIALLVLIHINNIDLEEHINEIGITQEQFNNLIDYKVTIITTKNKIYNRKNLLQTFKFKNKYTLKEYIESKLIKQITLKEIPYV